MNDLSTEKAFQKLVKGKRSWLQHLAGRYLQSAEEIEEVVQDVFMKVWRNAGRLSGNEYAVQKWLHTTTTRTAMDYNRSRQRLHTRIDYGVEIDNSGSCRLMGQEIVTAATVCEDNAGSYDPFVALDVAKFFDGLKMSHKEVLLLSLEGHSYEQIARITRRPIGTVRSRLHYARKKAEKALEKHR